MSEKFSWRWLRHAAAICPAACGLLLASNPAALAHDHDGSRGQWTMGSHDLNGSRHQPETRITPENAGKLKLKWVFTTGGDVSATPAVADGVVYFPDFAGNFFAVNAETGALVWKRLISDWTGISGDYARSDPAIYHGMVIMGNQAGALSKWNGSQIINGTGARVWAADAATGKLIWVTQVEKYPTAMITGSVVIHDDVIYVPVSSAEKTAFVDPSYPCCITRGSIVALEAKTGKLLWQTYTMPDNGGKVGGYSGGAVWNSTFVVDPKRHSLYVGTGNNYEVPIKDQLCRQNSANGGAGCDEPDDYFDSVLALDMSTGKVKWSMRGWPYDPWVLACIVGFAPGVGMCPPNAGPDYDFGAGLNLLRTGDDDDDELVGAGQKSGTYWALDPKTGKVVWKTDVGPAGATLGGIEWGTAFDGKRIYVAISDSGSVTYALQPSGTLVNSGSWAALDPKTGKILWQTATPGHCSPGGASGVAQGCMALGSVSVANDVVFGASMDEAPTNPTMFALDARTGKILWSYVTGSSVNAGPAIVGNSIYWGSGYAHIGTTFGTGNNKLFAFTID
jgi:polyvinyl alcohol dehydrogenase (cytochrome)